LLPGDVDGRDKPGHDVRCNSIPPEPVLTYQTPQLDVDDSVEALSKIRDSTEDVQTGLVFLIRLAMVALQFIVGPAEPRHVR
jgi:hypothetical protein